MLRVFGGIFAKTDFCSAVYNGNMSPNEASSDDIRPVALLLAHDLRNMFSVLNGLVILLERKQEPRYLEMMKKQLDFCEQMVNSFVRYADEGRSVLRSLNPGVLIEGLLGSLQIPPNIQVSLSVEYRGNMMGDPAQIRQIVWNLLGNALDACGANPARILIRVKEGDSFVCIEVQDTGPGISPEIREHLMEPGRSTKPRGLGLGLYLSRRLAELNGGRLEFDPSVGTGTTFRLWLPVT